MMAKNPDRRYQTAEEVSQVVTSWLQRNSEIENYHHIRTAPETQDSASSHEPVLFPQQLFTADESDAEHPSEMFSKKVSSVRTDEEAAPVSSASSSESEQELLLFLSGLESTETPPHASDTVAEVPEIAETPVETVDPSVPIAKQVTHSETAETSDAIPVVRTADESSLPQVPLAEPLQPEQVEPRAQHFDVEEVLGTNAGEAHAPRAADAIALSLTRSSKARRSPQRRKQKHGVNTLLVSAGALLLLIGIVFAVTSFLGNDPEPEQKAVTKKTNSEKTITPTKILPRIISVGPEGDFQSIAEAIAKVKESFVPRSRRDRQIIKVQGGRRYRERIVIDNSDQSFADIRIHLLSVGDQPAVLAPAAGDEPIFVLNGIKQFLLEGFELQADGGKTAVSLSGILIGTTLRNLKITGFSDSGIVGNGPVGQDVQRGKIVLEKIDFQAGNPNAVGIRFHSAGSNPSGIVVSKCRFFGPMSAGIHFDCGAVSLTVQHSIFSSAEVGIKFEAASPELKNVLIERNTGSSD